MSTHKARGLIVIALVTVTAGAVVAQECKPCKNGTDGEEPIHWWASDAYDVIARCDTAVAGHPIGCDDQSAHPGDCESRHPDNGCSLPAALADFARTGASVTATEVDSMLLRYERYLEIDRDMHQIRVVSCSGQIVALIDLPREYISRNRAAEPPWIIAPLVLTSGLQSAFSSKARGALTKR